MITPVPPSPATPAGQSQPSIAIVGASITGPTLALLLHQAGFTRVSVLEAAPTPYAQSGGVIGLDHVSLATLEALGIPQHELVPFPSEHVTAIHITDRRETRRTQFVYPGRNTGWHQLNTALLTRLPAGWLHPGHRVRALHPGDDGTAVLDLTGAAPLHADLVVFADGRRSLGRRLLDPSRSLRYAGYVAWRGQRPEHQPDLCAFTRYEPHTSQFNLFPILRPDGTTALDWTFYLNMSAERFRYLTGDDPTHRTYLLPRQIGAAARTVVLSEAQRLLPPQAAAIMDATSDWNAAPVLDIDPPHRMIHPVGGARAILLGDALAPVRPHTARGANHGIHQAHGLAIALAQHLHHGADLTAALTAWQERCLPAVHHALHLGPYLGAAMGLGLQPTPEPVPA
ncbi:FAD-dependent monooxygenase [[Actinomadura] parvosata]|uniref:FAD-dependent monooxygenase n=1 Tax=[Actinomadura] parvosata TaxID=1955412 RepID=UPI00406C33B5